MENPTGSVFCAHGRALSFRWNEVEDHMHLEYTLENPEEESDSSRICGRPGNGASLCAESKKKHPTAVPMAAPCGRQRAGRKIFTRTYVKWARRAPVSSSGHVQSPRHPASGSQICKIKPPEGAAQEEYLLVDAITLFLHQDDLNELARYNIERQRKLMDILSNYQGYKKMTLILVFDAYKVKATRVRNRHMP